MARATTPWGQAEIVEEFTVSQRAGERRFATIVQLLADEKGNELVRFAYSTDGTARRGPVTLRGRDLERFRAALSEHPAIMGALGMTAQALAYGRSRGASTSDARTRPPSADPSSGSTACSGCGISPHTLPASLTTPAMSRSEPLGFAPGAYRKRTCVSSRSAGAW